MALLTAQSPVITGTTPTYGAAGASDTVKFTQAPRFLIYKNASGGSINVTVVVPGSKHGQANPDVVVAVPASGERWIGPLTGDMAVDGIVTVTTSSQASVTVALVTV